jgi:hypothetical protein
VTRRAVAWSESDLQYPRSLTRTGYHTDANQCLCRLAIEGAQMIRQINTSDNHRVAGYRRADDGRMRSVCGTALASARATASLRRSLLIMVFLRTRSKPRADTGAKPLPRNRPH